MAPPRRARGSKIDCRDDNASRQAIQALPGRSPDSTQDFQRPASCLWMPLQKRSAHGEKKYLIVRFFSEKSKSRGGEPPARDASTARENELGAAARNRLL